MHPWKKIIRGNTEDLETKACFICLERIRDSDDDMKLKLHLFNVHSVKVHLKELVEMCTEEEEKEEREGWSIDDVLEEEWERREAEERKRGKSGGWMAIFRKKKKPVCLDNNVEAEINEVDCFLCQEVLKSCEFDEHLEKLHGVIFGLKEIKKAGQKCQSLPPEEPDHETAGETAPKISRTDADTVKELLNTR